MSKAGGHLVCSGLQGEKSGRDVQQSTTRGLDAASSRGLKDLPDLPDPQQAWMQAWMPSSGTAKVNLKKFREKTKQKIAKRFFFLALNTSCASVQGFFFGQLVQCGRHRSQL